MPISQNRQGSILQCLCSQFTTPVSSLPLLSDTPFLKPHVCTGGRPCCSAMLSSAFSPCLVPLPKADLSQGSLQNRFVSTWRRGYREGRLAGRAATPVGTSCFETQGLVCNQGWVVEVGKTVSSVPWGLSVACSKQAWQGMLELLNEITVCPPSMGYTAL